MNFVHLKHVTTPITTGPHITLRRTSYSFRVVEQPFAIKYVVEPYAVTFDELGKEVEIGVT